MKINELLKPNEGFNLNEAQVAGNRCCFHIPSRAGLKDFRAFQCPHHSPLPAHGLAFGIYSRFSWGRRVTGLSWWERAVFQCFHWLREHGKRSRASSVVPPRAEDPPPPSSPAKAAFPYVTPSALDMWGNNDVRKMGLDLCSLVSWEEL